MSGKRWMAQCAAWLMVAALAGVLERAEADEKVGRFDFAYRISGDRAARPIQVFDDGVSKTYFQFQAGAPVPLILVGRGPDAVVPAVDGPYHTVSGRALAYTLVLAGHTARIEHATLTPQAADLPGDRGGSVVASPTDRTLSSHATPIRGDVIEWIEPEQQANHDMTFVGETSQLSPGSRDALKAVSKRLGPKARVRVIVSGARGANALMRKRVAQVRQALIDNGMAARHIEVEGPANSEGNGWGTPSVISVQWRAPGQAQKAPTAVPARNGTAESSLSGQAGGRNVDIVATGRTDPAVLSVPTFITTGGPA